MDDVNSGFSPACRVMFYLHCSKVRWAISGTRPEHEVDTAIGLVGFTGLLDLASHCGYAIHDQFLELLRSEMVHFFGRTEKATDKVASNGAYNLDPGFFRAVTEDPNRQPCTG